MPIFHALGLLSDMGDRYWVLPERMIGGHRIGGFTSRDDRGVVRFLLFAHHAQDTQSRSEAAFDVALDFDALGPAKAARVREYRFDRDHNSPFRQIRTLRERSASGGSTDLARLAELTRALRDEKPAARREAIEKLGELDRSTREALLPEILKLAEAKDQGVREAAREAIKIAFVPEAYPKAAIEQVRKTTECRPTATTSRLREGDGRFRLTIRVAANGCNFVVIDPDEERRQEAKSNE